MRGPVLVVVAAYLAHLLFGRVIAVPLEMNVLGLHVVPSTAVLSVDHVWSVPV